MWHDDTLYLELIRRTHYKMQNKKNKIKGDIFKIVFSFTTGRLFKKRHPICYCKETRDLERGNDQVHPSGRTGLSLFLLPF